MPSLKPLNPARTLVRKFAYHEDTTPDFWAALEGWLKERPGTLVELSHKNFFMCKIMYKGAFIIVPDDEAMINALREATDRIERMERL
jgi:hypothetical protein